MNSVQLLIAFDLKSNYQQKRKIAINEKITYDDDDDHGGGDGYASCISSSDHIRIETGLINWPCEL